MKKTITLFTLLMYCAVALANITLPKIFGDNMVLQRNKPISIWGWGAANEKITVQFNQQTKITKADKAGKWQVMLLPENAGGPYQLVVKGKNEIAVKNILVGEVWICSGQSNMEMPIEGWGKINNYQQEIAAADYAMIRQFKVPNTVSTSLKNDIPGGEWKICNPVNAGDFSATAYFFAKKLYNGLKVPVGLINTSWGGTQSEAWTSQKGFAQSDEFKSVAAAMQSGEAETILKKQAAVILKNIKQAQGSIDKNVNTADWKNTNFDDSKWPVMKLPGLWEEQGFAGVDGVVWFRKTITLSEAEAGKSAILQLAKIDDNDETYCNGVKVGSTNKWDEPRKYTIPAGILIAGKNVITVRVEDNGGGGGIYGEAATMQLTTDNKIYSLAGDWFFKIASLINAGNTIGPNDYPGVLFNAMINPLIQYTIRGAIWYQGETNAGRAYQYRKAFPLMITDWRQHWNQGNFPFLFVQLSTFGSANANSNNGSPWAELREAQAMALSLPNTGMVVITDIGDTADIHPKNKQDVGKRLAAVALHDVYEKQGEFTGPVYQLMKIDKNHIVLTFTHTGTGWWVKDKYGYIKGFEAAGADKKFYPAKAVIEGDKIIVYNETVLNPMAVRYNWADDASEGNLFNKDGFPAAPFRTDDWEAITFKNKYAFGK
jgi:sialate O-acetylesterase